jgi:hypothetical protein
MAVEMSYRSCSIMVAASIAHARRLQRLFWIIPAPGASTCGVITNSWCALWLSGLSWHLLTLPLYSQFATGVSLIAGSV